MKVFTLQKQGMSVNKNAGTVSKFGFSMYCFEESVPGRLKFKDKKENKLIEEKYEDFFDEDSEE